MILMQPWPVRAGRTSWLVATAICIALLAGLAVFDARISDFGRSLPASVVTVFAWITRLGESDYIVYASLALLVAMAGLALLVRRPVAKRALWQLSGIWAFLLTGVGLPSLFTTLVKRLIGRSRPELIDSVGSFDFRTMSWVDWTYQSFPSGHATTAFALCFTVSFLVPRSFPWVLALAVLIALSRIVVGAHYPTDVIGGAVVGTLGAYLVRNAFLALGWVFRRQPDGGIARRPLVAVRRLLQRRG
jgi:membrane-associated phospholipid phosphatase